MAILSDAVSSVIGSLVVDDEDSSVEFAGPVTKSKYARWFRTERFSARSESLSGGVTEDGREFFHNLIIDMEFDLLSQSDFIVENFFNLSHELRQCVEEFARDRASFHVIDVFVRLAVRTPGVVSKHKARSAVDVIYGYQDHILEMSSDSEREVFNRALYSFLSVCKGTENDSPIRIVLSMLSMRYGAERIVNQMKRWVSSQTVGSLADFVSVTESWEPAYSELPLDWIVNLVQSENIE